MYFSICVDKFFCNLKIMLKKLRRKTRTMMLFIFQLKINNLINTCLTKLHSESYFICKDLSLRKDVNVTPIYSILLIFHVQQ